MEGSHEQCLKLVQPLPLGRKPAQQWMRAMEAAVGYSIACQFTECQAAMPGGLFNQGTEPEGIHTFIFCLHSNWYFYHLSQTLTPTLSTIPLSPTIHIPIPTTPTINHPHHPYHHSSPPPLPSTIPTFSCPSCQHNSHFFASVVRCSLNSINLHGYTCHLGPDHTECSCHGEWCTDVCT